MLIKKSLPLWDQCNNADLINKKDTMGLVAFNRGFRQIPYSAKDLLFPSFKNCWREGELNFSREDFALVVAGVDLSTATRPGNVIFVLGIKHNGNRVPLQIYRGDWTSPNTARYIIKAFNVYETDMIFVENNALQTAITEWMAELPKEQVPNNMKIKGFHTGSQKSHPELGLPGLEVEFEKGIWDIYLPKHEFQCECGWCTWKNEMKGYPYSTTTDTVMACWFAREAVRKWEACKGKGNLGKIDSLRGVSQWQNL